MNCNRELISQYYDGELSPEKAAEVKRHLQLCESCTALLEEYRHISLEIKALPRHFAPQALRQQVYSGIQQKHIPASRRVLFLPVFSGITLAAASVMLMLFLSNIFHFMDTQRSIMVTGSSPQNRAENVAPDASLQVKFNAPLDGESASKAVSINPPVEARVKVDGESLVIAPVEPFKPGTSYTVTVDTNVKDMKGSTLNEPVVLTFKTKPDEPTSTVAVAVDSPSAPYLTPSPVSSVVAITPISTTITPRLLSGEVSVISQTAKNINVRSNDLSAWTVELPSNTNIILADGSAASFSDINVGSSIEVTGTLGSGPTVLVASTLRIKDGKVAPVTPVPMPSEVKIAYVSAPNSTGYTDDWVSHLKSKGFEVNSFSISDESKLDFTGYQLLVIGITANLESDTAVKKIRESKLPILNGSPSLAPRIGQGTAYDPGNPGRTVYGKTINIETANDLTSGYSGEVTLTNDTLYRNPIRSAMGTVLASIKDEQGSKGTVWSVSDAGIYFGFWYSKDGTNHNQAYWLFFDRSVAHLLGIPSLPVPAPTSSPSLTPTAPTPVSPTPILSTPTSLTPISSTPTTPSPTSPTPNPISMLTATLTPTR